MKRRRILRPEGSLRQFPPDPFQSKKNMQSVNFNWKIKDIYLSQLDWTETSFRLTYNRPLPPLVHSIRTIGIQHPMVLQEVGPERYRIVAGWRRLRALQSIGLESIQCRIAPAEIPDGELLIWNFYDNLDRGFNPVEQVLAIKKMSAFVNEKALLDDILPLLGLASKTEILRRYLTIGELSPSYQNALFQNRLFPETIESSMRDFPNLTNCILALFIFLQWGYQKQKEFLADLLELSKRSGQDPRGILFSKPITEIFQYSLWSPQQKGAALRKYFRACLFPALTETEKAFSRSVASLNLDQRTKIAPPPFFEGGKYRLEVAFSSNRELSQSLERILPSLEEEKFDGLP